MKWFQLSLALCMAFAMRAAPCVAAKAENRDESRVPPYTLPDPLTDAHGKRIATADEWVKKRRPEILRLFETEVYGRAPAQKPEMRYQVTSEDRGALGGKAIRKEVTIQLSTPRGQLPLHVLLYLPKSDRPVPVFLGLNFHGNQAVHSDPAITLASCWVLSRPEVHGIVDNRATEASRGVEASRWQVEQVVSRGYGVATMCCGDIDPDFDDGFQNGVHPLFYRAGQTAPEADEWGTIAAWAWGLSLRAGLSRNRFRGRCQARGGLGPLATGQDGLVGRRERSAFRHGDIELFRLRRGGAEQTHIRRNGWAHQ